MPGFDRDQVAIDNAVENRQLGSVLLTLGWVLLWMDAIFGIYFFISLRNGSWFWPVWLGVQGALGLLLVVMGTRYRKAVGATRLGQRDMERTMRQQRQEDVENHRVA